MCPDVFTFGFARVTGLDSTTRPRNCEREIVLHATACHWVVRLGPPQPLGMQAPHSFETSASLTQRHSVTSHSHKLWQCVAPHFRAFASLYSNQPRTVQAVATDCYMNTTACNSNTTNSGQLVLTALQNESLFAVTFK
jgi:hypothetical protein